MQRRRLLISSRPREPSAEIAFSTGGSSHFHSISPRDRRFTPPPRAPSGSPTSLNFPWHSATIIRIGEAATLSSGDRKHSRINPRARNCGATAAATIRAARKRGARRLTRGFTTLHLNNSVYGRARELFSEPSVTGRRKASRYHRRFIALAHLASPRSPRSACRCFATARFSSARGRPSRSPVDPVGDSGSPAAAGNRQHAD